MNLCYEHKDAMTFIGFSTEILNAEGYIKCPEFWDYAFKTKFSKVWSTGKPETDEEQAILDNEIGTFALCIMHGEKSFTYMIAGLYKGGIVPEGMHLFEVAGSDYAVFSNKGPLPNSLQDLNKYVWNQWYPGEGQQYDPNGDTTIEVYSGNPSSEDYECGIWVPVRKRA